MLHLTEKQAYRELAKLVEKGALELVGQGAGARYLVVKQSGRPIKIKTQSGHVLINQYMS